MTQCRRPGSVAIRSRPSVAYVTRPTPRVENGCGREHGDVTSIKPVNDPARISCRA
jgi:hypothetical protein